jgi:hypothetical protein
MTKRKAKTYEAEFNGRKTRVTVPENTDTESDPVDLLRRAANAVSEQNRSVLFVENECPFVDAACEKIERGGTLDATSLSSLIYYIADMME